MTFSEKPQDSSRPAIITPDTQRAMMFLGGLLNIKIDGGATAGRLAVLEHEEERGHASPLHRHDLADETFLVLEGELRVEVDGVKHTAGAGAVAFLPRRLSHAFVVTSPQARFLTMHTPSGFEDFVRAAGTPLVGGVSTPGELPPIDRAALGALARSHGIEILGPRSAPLVWARVPGTAPTPAGPPRRSCPHTVADLGAIVGHGLRRVD